MNCKKDDLCEYIGRAIELRGMYFKCVERDTDSRRGPRWIVSPPYPDSKIYAYKNTGSIHDESLRPIKGGESPEESTEAMKRLHDTSKETA